MSIVNSLGSLWKLFDSGWLWSAYGSYYGNCWLCGVCVDGLYDEYLFWEWCMKKVWRLLESSPLSWGKELTKGYRQILSRITIVEGTNGT